MEPQAEKLPRPRVDALDEILGDSFPVLDDGFVRVVADAADHRLLGAQAVGPHVSEVAAACGLAIEMEASLEDPLALAEIARAVGISKRQLEPLPLLGDLVGEGTHGKGMVDVADRTQPADAHHGLGFARLHEWSDWFGRHFRKGDWDVCTPDVARELSAIGHAFARRVHLASGLFGAAACAVHAWQPVMAD